jgi:hypothetical protein
VRKCFSKDAFRLSDYRPEVPQLFYCHLALTGTTSQRNYSVDLLFSRPTGDTELRQKKTMVPYEMPSRAFLTVTGVTILS